MRRLRQVARQKNNNNYKGEMKEQNFYLPIFLSQTIKEIFYSEVLVNGRKK